VNKCIISILRHGTSFLASIAEQKDVFQDVKKTELNFPLKLIDLQPNASFLSAVWQHAFALIGRLIIEK
jgi:hypothetical protein